MTLAHLHPLTAPVALPARAGGDGPLRIHVCMREPYDRAGGLHSYVRGLVAGQEALGLRPVVVDRVSGRGGFSVAHGDPRWLAGALPAGSVVEYHFAHAALPFVLGARGPWAGLPRVFHFHGPWFAEGRVQGHGRGRVLAKRAVERVVLSRFDRYVTASDAFAGTLVDAYGVRAEQVTTVHPGVDTERFTATGARAAARAALGIDHEGVLLVAVRRLEPRMGLEHGIRALQWLPGAKLAIAGQGSSRADLEAAARAAGVADRVVFLGRVPDALLPAVYRAGDVSVVPTVSLEGFGMVVVESFAAGTPVVASRVGGLAEAMGPFAAGWTVDPGDARGLALAAGRAVGDAELAGAVRRYAETRTLAVMAAEIEAALGERRA